MSKELKVKDFEEVKDLKSYISLFSKLSDNEKTQIMYIMLGMNLAAKPCETT